ncbi:hypothetical protein EVJ58_g10047 [Rhodofomes roseus]|uniref:Uncharacterized protein n=1 Tax=Rhodofomes roseus TaxID=34475 RepID=A0A4Y9XV18_9APHY|nr:hypothetical protein EVJ58_g10047 [Rhodofomes roseus]
MGFHNGVEGYSGLVFTATEAQFSLEEALETAFDHFRDPRSFRQDAEEGLAGEEMDQDMAEGVRAGDHEVSNTAEEQEHDEAAASVKPKQTRNKLSAHAKKKAKKAKKLQQAAAVREAVQESHVKRNLNWTACRLQALATQHGAMRPRRIGQHKETTLESLIEQGFDYMEWDGMTAVPILNHEGIALLAGHPADAMWHKVTDDLINDLKALERDFKLEKKHNQTAQPQSAFLQHPSHRQLHSLQSLAALRAIWQFLHGDLGPLSAQQHARHPPDVACPVPDLVPNVPPGNGPPTWAGKTVNTSAQSRPVVTVPHRVYANLAWGWCLIVALGDFDPKKGGQLVPWDLKLVINFPSGSSILIPSSLLLHSNTVIQDGEDRRSITCYSAGALHRWVDQGMQTKVKFQASMDGEKLEESRQSELQ